MKVEVHNMVISILIVRNILGWRSSGISFFIQRALIIELIIKK